MPLRIKTTGSGAPVLRTRSDGDGRGWAGPPRACRSSTAGSSRGHGGREEVRSAPCSSTTRTPRQDLETQQPWMGSLSDLVEAVVDAYVSGRVSPTDLAVDFDELPGAAPRLAY